MNIVRILILTYSVICLIFLLSALAPSMEYETNGIDPWSDSQDSVPLPSPSDIPDRVVPPEQPINPPESPPMPYKYQDNTIY